MAIGFGTGIPYREGSVRSIGAGMTDGKQPQPSESLETEFLTLMAGQARRVLIPVFLVSGMIASFASHYVPRQEWVTWLAAVLAILIARAVFIPMLLRMPNLQHRSRLLIIMALSLAHGSIQGYSLIFFPEMGVLEQSMQTLLLLGLCMAAISTTGGHLPFFLAFVLPIIIPLIVFWTSGLGGFEMTQLDISAGLALLLFSAVLVSVAYNMYEQFKNSFEARQQQVLLNRQLLEANDAKTRFLATASHDLRQPMQALTASIESLRFQELNNESRGIVDDLNVARKDLSELLGALLDISRLDASVEDVETDNFNLYRLLFTVWDEQRRNAESKNLELRMNCPETAFACSNPVQFKRIISNLVSNAIRYTDSGYVSISADRIDTNYVIKITDTGIGIAESEQVRIFEDFYQACYPARSQKRGGLGLGLSIVRRLTDLLGIELSLTSTLGKGSEFVVSLPAVASTSSETIAKHRTDLDFVGLKILVIDDEAAVASALKKMLENVECNVRTAGGAAEATRLAQEDKPDVLLVDRRLQGAEDGLSVINEIRTIYPKMPAILISGDTAPDRINEARIAGIPLLAKPAQLEDIQRMVATVCNNQSGVGPRN